MTTIQGYNINKESIEIIENTKEFKKKLINMIKAAQNRIYITALYVEKDEAGMEFIHELLKVKQKNPAIKIKVVVDYHRSQRNKIGEKDSLTNWDSYNKINNQYNNKIEFYAAPVKTKEVLGVFHLKGFIIDDQVLYTGASINNTYTHQNDNYRLDRYQIISQKEIADEMINFIDTNIIIKKDVQAILSENKPSRMIINRFVKKYKKILRNSKYNNPKCEQGSRIKLLSGLGSKENDINNTIKEIISSAKKEIRIYTPYFNIPMEVIDILKKKTREDCTISFIVGDKTTNDFYNASSENFHIINIIPFLYEQNLRKFAESFEEEIHQNKVNIHIWKKQNNSFHLKGISIDDQTHMITGHNLNPRAWSLDLENALLIEDEDKHFSEMFKNEFETILKDTFRVKQAQDIQNEDDYQENIKKIINKLDKFKLSKLIKKII